MSVSYSYKEEPLKELHNNQAYETAQDFDNKAQLKESVKDWIKNLTCSSCGGHRLKGEGVVISFGKVRFYVEEYKKGLLGGGKYVERHDKDMWRIYDVYLENKGWFNLGGGWIKCKSCQWKISGHNAISINDIVRRF